MTTGKRVHVCNAAWTHEPLLYRTFNATAGAGARYSACRGHAPEFQARAARAERISCRPSPLVIGRDRICDRSQCRHQSTQWDGCNVRKWRRALRLPRHVDRHVLHVCRRCKWLPATPSRPSCRSKMNCGGLAQFTTRPPKWCSCLLCSQRGGSHL